MCRPTYQTLPGLGEGGGEEAGGLSVSLRRDDGGLLHLLGLLHEESFSKSKWCNLVENVSIFVYDIYPYVELCMRRFGGQNMRSSFKN